MSASLERMQMGGGVEAEERALVLAEKLNHLFGTVLHPEGRPYKNEEVARLIAESGKGKVSVRTIQKMRAAVSEDHGMGKIQALASFFGVPTAYFFDDRAEADVPAEAALRAAMRNAGIRQVALRADGLSPEGMELVRDVIERVRKSEGLSDS
ncbi:hypothetical protein ACWD6P_10705 [Streptomyces sp. NPDC002446]